MALPSRLCSARSIMDGSAQTSRGWSGISSLRVQPFWAQTASYRSLTSSHSCPMSKRTRSHFSAPLVTLLSSITLDTRAVRRSASSTMMFSCSSRWALSSPVMSRTVSAYPLMRVSGVRRSWLTLASRSRCIWALRCTSRAM